MTYSPKVGQSLAQTLVNLHKITYNRKMFEIELKAHVYDRDALVQKVKTFATFSQKLLKNDTYYHLPKENATGEQDVCVRLRTEVEITDTHTKQKHIFTYKRKEKKVSDNGIETEFNDEKECELSSFDALESFFQDAGFTPYLTKQKSVEDYIVNTPCGKATLELCEVARLGDFLEIEILSESNDEKTVSRIQAELKNLLAKCGIPETDIENRYYSELLAESNNGN